MTNPMVRIYTSVDEYVDREMNAQELKQWQLDKAQVDAQEAEAAAKAAQRQALLERLGITEDEARLLLG